MNYSSGFKWNWLLKRWTKHTHTHIKPAEWRGKSDGFDAMHTDWRPGHKIQRDERWRKSEKKDDFAGAIFLRQCDETTTMDAAAAVTNDITFQWNEENPY